MWFFCKNNYNYVSSCRSSELVEGQVWRTLVAFCSLPTDHVAPPSHERMLYERRITTIAYTMVDRSVGSSPNVADVRLSALVASNRSDFNRTQIVIVQSLLYVHKMTTNMLGTGLDISSLRSDIQTAIDHVCACSEEIPLGAAFDRLMLEIMEKTGDCWADVVYRVLDVARVGGRLSPPWCYEFQLLSSDNQRPDEVYYGIHYSTTLMRTTTQFW